MRDLLSVVYVTRFVVTLSPVAVIETYTIKTDYGSSSGVMHLSPLANAVCACAPAPACVCLLSSRMSSSISFVNIFPIARRGYWSFNHAPIPTHSPNSLVSEPVKLDDCSAIELACTWSTAKCRPPSRRLCSCDKRSFMTCFTLQL
jgi:hypothetical protein